MRKLFLLAFSPLIIGSLWLMTYYGIISNDIGEKVFAVVAITLFIAWLVNPLIFGDTFFEDEDAQSKNLNIKKTAILLILVVSGTSIIVFSHSVSNFVAKAEKKDRAIIKNCDMKGQNFERKTYTNTDFVNVNFTGSSFKDAIFMHCNFINCNMNSMQAINTEISDSVIKECYLMTANFDSSNFTNSKIENCNMKNSCFSFAVFFITDIVDCNIDESDFTKASFYKASISDCQMNKTILDEATFCEMVLERCDLANAYGSVLLAGIDSKMIDCKHVALCTDAVKLEVFDKDELIATSYKTALFS